MKKKKKKKKLKKKKKTRSLRARYIELVLLLEIKFYPDNCIGNLIARIYAKVPYLPMYVLYKVP